MDEASDDRDPVAAEFGDSEDLYDVAEWEQRSALDGIATLLYAILRAAKSSALVVLALALFLGLFGLMFLTIAEQPVLGVLSLLSILPAVVLMGYLWVDDPTQREPIEYLAVTFLLSVLFATFAAVLNSLFRPLFSLVPVVGLAVYFFVVVGPIEESVKWLSIRLYAFDGPTFNTVVDGVVYGAVAGLGFAAIENLTYILQAFVMVEQAGQAAQLQSAVQTAFGRFFVGPGHVLFSALAGYYLGLAKFNPEHKGPIVVKGLLIAASVHAFYNTVVSYAPLSQLGFVAFVLVFDGILLAIILRKVSRYESYYHRIGEEGDDGDPPEEQVPEPN